MAQIGKPVITIFLTLLLVLAPCLAWAHGQPVSGTVQVQGGKKLKKMILYLEPANSSFPISHNTHKVTQKGRRFNPGLQVITQGDTVEFINNEDKEIDHNVYSLAKTNIFDLGLGEKGSTLKVKFEKEGKVNYYCSVHKRMEGKLFILPSRYHTILKTPGDFKIDNVPPGRWVLKATHLHRRYKSKTLEFTVGNQPVSNLVLEIVKK